MQSVSEMQLYFKGERDIGITVLVIGVVMAAVLFYLWKIYRQPLGYGLMIPGGLFMILGFVIGPVLITSSNQRIQTYTQQIQTDTPGFLRVEKPRMDRVNANWIRLKITWAILALLCMGTIFFVKREFWVGVALGFFFLSASLMILDTFAEKRALRYSSTLQ